MTALAAGVFCRTLCSGWGIAEPLDDELLEGFNLRRRHGRPPPPSVPSVP